MSLLIPLLFLVLMGAFILYLTSDFVFTTQKMDDEMSFQINTNQTLTDGMTCGDIADQIDIGEAIWLGKPEKTLNALEQLYDQKGCVPEGIEINIKVNP